MPTTTREQRRGLVMEVQSLISGGKNNREVVLTLVARGISQATAYRMVQVAEADWNRSRRRFDKGRSLSVALARAQKAMVMAQDAKKHVVLGGEIRELPDPDAKAFIAAAQHEAKLLGLYAPEKHEVFVANFARAMQMLVELIDREVEDVSLRGRLIQGMRGIFEEAPKAKALPSGDTVSRETVIDVPIVSRETKVP